MSIDRSWYPETIEDKNHQIAIKFLCDNLKEVFDLIATNPKKLIKGTIMSLSKDRIVKEEEALSNKEYKKYLSREPNKSIDNINHPPHYNNSNAKCECGHTIECIEVTRHLSFNIGNAMKYLWRCELKGNTIEDLKKSIWYIQDEIAQRSK